MPEIVPFDGAALRLWRAGLWAENPPFGENPASGSGAPRREKPLESLKKLPRR